MINSQTALDRSDAKKYDYTKPVDNPIFDAHIPQELVTFEKYCINTHFYGTQSKHAYWKKYRVNQPKRTYANFPQILKKIEFRQYLKNLKNRNVHSSTVHLYDYSYKTPPFSSKPLSCNSELS